VIEPIRLAFDVYCTPERAWEVWTARIGQWWPADHTVSTEDGLQIFIEDRVGGRIYERTPGGLEHDWGEVTVWEPPTRLVYLWHLRRAPADATEVEIRFTIAEGDVGTRVEIEHRGWERIGADGITWRDRNFGGWSTLLPHYIAAAGGGSSPITNLITGGGPES